MSAYEPNFEHMRHALLFMFNQGKKVSESHRALVEVYGDRALTLRTCETWFRKFKEGNFDLDDAARSGKRKSFDDAKLQSLLDEDDTQTQRQLAEALGVQQQAISKRLRAMGKIQKCGKWVPHELTERQMENRKVTCEMLLQRYKRKTRWKDSSGKCLTMRLTHQTWPHPTTTSLPRWATHYLSSASILMKICENGSSSGSTPKAVNSTGKVSTNCQKDGKNV